MKALYPGAAAVCYVNSTAEVKAESDICCTSANAVQVTDSLDEEQVIFAPDANLASYISRFTDKTVIPWDGHCYVHSRITPEQVLAARIRHPEAEVLVHPECGPEVIDLADRVCSTSGMSKHARQSSSREFIIGTEAGMIHRLTRDNPGRLFFPLSQEAICQNMKKTDLEKVLQSLQTLQPRVSVPQEVASRARGAIERMLAL
ncbi:MAG: quinolinate synthase NadA [Methanosarcinales archaeon]|nr:quinolinate synthase NadA [Methanosarcinales archaeon]